MLLGFDLPFSHAIPLGVITGHFRTPGIGMFQSLQLGADWVPLIKCLLSFIIIISFIFTTPIILGSCSQVSWNTLVATVPSPALGLF